MRKAIVYVEISDNRKVGLVENKVELFKTSGHLLYFRIPEDC